MTNRKSTKRALLGSVVAMVLCLAMLVGATFAWFTDTASTGVNKIQAGNLDVQLMYSTDMKTWKEATDATQLFDDHALWEPGHTEVVYMKLVNNGNLALKYETEFSHNYNVSKGKSVLGNYYYVGDYLKIGTATVDSAFATREEAQAAVSGNEQALKKGAQLTNGWISLGAGESTDPFAVVIYMPASVGNEANAKSKTWISKITGIGLEVQATQDTVESDSFGSTYDENAATTLSRVEYTSGTHEVTGNIQASGEWGAIHVKGGTTTVSATTVYAVETGRYAIAVWAENNGTVVINGGEFAQQITGDSNQYDLIYADDNAQIIINGGTFKCATPQWTLNCKDGSTAHITVNGGTFYKYNPAESASGAGEVVLGEGCTVVQNGDWYTVVKN